MLCPITDNNYRKKWFQYKLEGLDKNWIKTKQTELYYTNLDPGKYTLHVASINEKERAKFGGNNDAACHCLSVV